MNQSADPQVPIKSLILVPALITLAITLLRLGAARAAGHSSAEVTRKIYLHSIPGEQRRAVEEVERLVIGPKRTQVDETKENGRWVIN